MAEYYVGHVLAFSGSFTCRLGFSSLERGRRAVKARNRGTLLKCKPIRGPMKSRLACHCISSHCLLGFWSFLLLRVCVCLCARRYHDVSIVHVLPAAQKADCLLQQQQRLASNSNQRTADKQRENRKFHSIASRKFSRHSATEAGLKQTIVQPLK